MSYLAMFEKVSREKLIEVFWPDVPLSKAQNQLRVSLCHLRKILRDYSFILEITPQFVRISENYQCDVIALQQKLYQYQMTKNVHERLSIAVDILSNWTNNILEDFYDDWAIELKRKLENSLFSLLEDAYKLSIELNEPIIASQIENILKEDIEDMDID
ncbi:AfsR/SARP family transcriptional regulator [Anoxybacillus ayderensis]|nr:hypothetical protein LR68_04458 [Anoxybacillus sp. BCO1]MED0686442.1 hypothetical protein [Anoxybacillus ayderensis]